MLGVWYLLWSGVFFFFFLVDPPLPWVLCNIASVCPHGFSLIWPDSNRLSVLVRYHITKSILPNTKNNSAGNLSIIPVHRYLIFMVCTVQVCILGWDEKRNIFEYKETFIVLIAFLYAEPVFRTRINNSDPYSSKKVKNIILKKVLMQVFYG